MFASNGRFYTLDASKLPGGRGHGEPIRLYADLEQETEIVSVAVFQGGRKLIVGSAEGRGFVVPEDECLGNTRKGKQILNVKAPDIAHIRDLAASVREARVETSESSLAMLIPFLNALLEFRSDR